MLQQFRRILSSTDLVGDALRLRSLPKQKIVIDFSSPNIAKTFHMGNLRSTLHGNFIRKICKSAGHDVHTINYLGDWGTQFATLALYWRLIGNEGERICPEKWAEFSSKQKVEYLTDCYAKAHTRFRYNENLQEKARKLFAEMEFSLMNPKELENPMDAILWWKEWREISIDYLKSFYDRFGVEFDEWTGESDQLPEAHRICDELIRREIAILTADNLWAIRDIDGKVVIKKSDNSTLYLTRDIGAILNRDRVHKADKYYYIADSAQHRHFYNLQLVIKILGEEELSKKIQHLAYGRIIGLSTREGKNDSVDFLCQRGEKEAKLHIEQSPTTKLKPEEMPETFKELSKSVIVFDLMKRNKHGEYTFSFKGAFNLDQNNALLLHEKYSRLTSLELANPEIMERIKTLENFDRHSLELSAPAQNLARFLYEFDTVVMSSYEQLEPCTMTIYLVKLSNQIGKSMSALRVRGEVERIALPRLMLFSAAKKVLGDGMRLIGMKPLEKL